MALLPISRPPSSGFTASSAHPPQYKQTQPYGVDLGNWVALIQCSLGMMNGMTTEDREAERKRLIQVEKDFGKQAPERHRGDLPKEEQATINMDADAAHKRLVEMAKEDEAEKQKP